MKSFIVLALFVAAAVALPAAPVDENAEIIKYENDNIGVHRYDYNYETSNNIKASESGQLKNAGTENEAIEVHGTFSYVGEDGLLYKVDYVANEHGFQPSGDHLPKA